MILEDTAHSIIRDRPPALLPRTLRRRDIRIRPTRYGFAFILLLLAMFVGSVNYNNNLGFLLTFLLGSMAFVSIIQTFKNVAGLTIIAVASRPVFAGGQAIFEIALQDENKSHDRIGVALSNGDTTHFDIAKNDHQRVRVGVPAASRGILRPGPLSVSSDYPLGLFRGSVEVHLPLECIVYPRPIRHEVKTTAAGSSGHPSGATHGSGVDDLEGLKSYTPGDPPQRISWRASSRGQGLYVKNFSGQLGSSVYLDWQTLKEPDRERKLSLLCHMVLAVHQNNTPYGLKLPDRTICPDKGDIHRHRCLKALALFDF